MESLLGLLGSASTTEAVEINVEPLVDGIVDGIVLLTYLLYIMHRYNVHNIII